MVKKHPHADAVGQAMAAFFFKNMPEKLWRVRFRQGSESQLAIKGRIPRNVGKCREIQGWYIA